MKKLMTVLASAAMAFGLYADEPKNTIGFESPYFEPDDVLNIELNDQKGSGEPIYWDSTDTTAENIVQAYGEGARYAYTEGDRVVTDGPGNNYLEVNTAATLYRTVAGKAAGAQAIGDGVFFDTLVKLTVGDSIAVPELDVGAKLAIFAAADGDNEGAPTNLYVTAASLKDGVTAPAATNFILNVGANFDFTAWHRITVRSIKEVTENSKVAGFVIFIDGKLVEAADADYEEKIGYNAFNDVAAPFYGDKQLFVSLIEGDTIDAQKVTAVGFKGSGAIDDVSITDNANAPAFARAEVAFTLNWTAGLKSFTYNNITTNVNGEAGSVTIPLQGSLTVAIKDVEVATGYMPGTWTCDEETTELNGRTFTWKAVGANGKIVADKVAYTIGADKYATFDAALAAAVAAGTPTTITLAGNTTGWTEMAKIEDANAKVTLDLAGNTLTFAGYADPAVFFVKAGELTVIDSEGSGKIAVTTVAGIEDWEGVFYAQNTGVINIGAPEGDKGITVDGLAIAGLNGGKIYFGSFDKVNNTSKDALEALLADAENYEIKEAGDYWTVAEKQAEEPVYCYAEVWLNGVKTEQKAAPGDGDHKYAPGTQVTVKNAAFFENALFDNGILYVSKMTAADGKEATFSFDGTTFTKVSGDLEVTYDWGMLSMTVTTKGAVAPATEEVLGKIELTTFKQKCYAEVVFDSKVVGTAQPGDDHMYAKGDVAQIVNLGVITTEQVAGLDLPEGTYYVKEATDGEKSWTFSYDGTTFAKESGDGSIAVSGNVITMSLTVGTSAKLGTITLAKYEKQQGWDVPSGDEDKPASQVWETIPSNLADVPAGKLSNWAKANEVPFGGEFTETMSDAYLLDCAPTPEKVAEEKAKINIASIEFVNGKWVVTTVSGNIENQEFGNGKLQLVDVTEAITGAEGSDATKLWRMKLVPITATEE